MTSSPTPRRSPRPRSPRRCAPWKISTRSERTSIAKRLHAKAKNAVGRGSPDPAPNKTCGQADGGVVRPAPNKKRVSTEQGYGDLTQADKASPALIALVTPREGS